MEESPEGGYEARASGYAIFTQADSLEELRKMIRDALNCHFDDGENLPLFAYLQGLKPLSPKTVYAGAEARASYRN